MALGNVIIKDVDGNIPYAPPSDQERVTGLLFDTSLQPALFTAEYGKNNEGRLRQNDVVYITSRKSSITDFGIIERIDVTNPDEENNENFMHGIPAYHIREFFRMSAGVDGPGKLYVMFADCSRDWDAIDTMQRVAGGQINQLGVSRLGGHYLQRLLLEVGFGRLGTVGERQNLMDKRWCADSQKRGASGCCRQRYVALAVRAGGRLDQHHNRHRLVGGGVAPRV